MPLQWPLIILLLLVLLLILVLVVCVKMPRDRIVELTCSEDVTSYLKKEKSAVLFYSQGCHWCDNMKPEFEQLARERSDWHFARVNAEKVPDIVKANGLTGYPSLLFQSGGKISTIVGYRSASQLSSALPSQPTLYIVSATSWCHFSKKMSAQVSEIQKELGNTVKVVHVKDSDKNYASLSKKYDIRGFPTSVLVNGDGVVLGKIVGYHDSEDFVREVRKLVET